MASVSFTEIESEEVNLSIENITEEVVQDLLVVQDGAKQQSSSEIDGDFKQSVVPEKNDEKDCEDSSFARVYALATFHSENDQFMEERSPYTYCRLAALSLCRVTNPHR